jgi:hypothetical protein
MPRLKHAIHPTGDYAMSTRFLALAFAAAGSLLAACARDTTTTGPAIPAHPRTITYGTTDATNTYSNVGAFIVRRSDGQIFPFCSGTLIAASVFLTAAHCTQYFLTQLAPNGFTAFVSFENPIPWGPLTSSRTKLLPAVAVISNPNYNRSQDDAGDIGVVTLNDRGTRGIAAATLPALNVLARLAAQGTLQTSQFTAVGYGVQERSTGGGTPGYADQNPEPRLYAFSSYLSLGNGFLRLSQNPSTGDGGSCFGDSGGPVFLDIVGTRTLVATTVSGDAVCRATSSNQRLDTRSSRSFLGQYVSLP